MLISTKLWAQTLMSNVLPQTESRTHRTHLSILRSTKCDFTSTFFLISLHNLLYCTHPNIFQPSPLDITGYQLWVRNCFTYLRSSEERQNTVFSNTGLTFEHRQLLPQSLWRNWITLFFLLYTRNAYLQAMCVQNLMKTKEFQMDFKYMI